MNKRTGEKVGAAIGLIGSIVVGVLMIWQQTKPMRTEATFQKLKNELPKKIDDRTTAVDVDFDRRLVGDSEFVNITYSYVIDFALTIRRLTSTKSSKMRNSNFALTPTHHSR
jgi:hypothetical protein